MSLPRLGLRFRLLAILIGLALVTSLLTAAVALAIVRKALLDQRSAAGISVTRALAHGCSAFLPPSAGPEDPIVQSTFKRYVGSLHLNEPPRVALLVDRAGRVTASMPQGVGPKQVTLPPNLGAGQPAGEIVQGPGGPELALSVPWPSSGTPVGAIQTRFPLGPIEEGIQATARLMVLYIALSAVLLLLAGLYLLNRSLVRPVEALVAFTERADPGELEVPLDEEGGDEIARLSRSLKAMLARIEADRGQLQEHVTELTRINAELEAAQSSLIRSEKLASVGRLAAGVAHEVGNPLAAILGFVSLLKRRHDAGDIKGADYLDRIEQETTRINEILRDLLDYSRPGKVELKATPTTAVLKDAIQLLSSLKRFQRAALVTAIPDDLPLATCDPRRLKQVLINLLLNAADAVGDAPGVAAVAYAFPLDADPEAAYQAAVADLEPAAPLPEFPAPAEHLTLPPGSQVVSLTVVDSGAGIAPEDLDRIFDPFFTTKEPGQGTGLGLAVSARIVETFGGQLLVQSTPGHGTRFQVWLPAPPPTPPTPSP